MAWEWVDEKYVWREEPDNSCNRCTQDGQMAAYLAPITPGVLLSDEGVRNIGTYPQVPTYSSCDPAACMPGVATPDQCPECRCAPGEPHNRDCPELDYCVDYEALSDELLKAAGIGAVDHPDDSDVVDPRLSAEMEKDAADWEYVPIRGDSPKADVPFQTQEWFMDEYFGAAFMTIDELVDENYDLLRKMCHERLREGYVVYGSQMYGWDAKTRLRNILEELADAVIYISSGPVR